MVKAWVRHDHPYAALPSFTNIHSRMPVIGNLDDEMNNRRFTTRKRTSRKKAANGSSKTASLSSTEVGLTPAADGSAAARGARIDDYFSCRNGQPSTEASGECPQVSRVDPHTEVDVPCPNAAALPGSIVAENPPYKHSGVESPQNTRVKTVSAKATANKHQRTQRGSAGKTSKQDASETTKKAEVQSHALTEYFPVRRSVRKTRTTLKKEKQKHVEEAILTGNEEGFEVIELDDKGRGVITTKHVRAGEFVLEYAGELISVHEAKEREHIYAKDNSIGCYMYYFTCRNKQYCVDATQESGRLGRLVNHSKKGNLKTQTCIVQGTPRLVLVAQRDITPGEELLYDYGDRSKASIQSYPWLAL
ncbi:N-lysine methyltransferase KMT5A-like isoform X1 [Ornithodoros turicata]|uniref:N-lysine methyltransferase KMT5A-like isoform X1 n=1 Tax=Ornithodoros turicata TaxID=34597 RepID=UPI003138B62F